MTLLTIYLALLSQLSQQSAVSLPSPESRFGELHRISAHRSNKLPSLDAVRNMSSVDYMACCGAGHRISKLSDAYYASKILGFGLRSFWGYCDNVEVYHFLFGPQPLEELQEVSDFGHFVRFNNEVPGFGKFSRDPKGTCPCVMDKAQRDVEFYSSHRERFRSRKKVQEFRDQHFHSNATIVGLHIRAGNGETGDFSDRGRNIVNQDEWINSIANRLLEQKWTMPLVLFVATDTKSMVPKLENLLKDQPVTVVQLVQFRPEDGKGVMFGERGKVLNTGFICRRSWESTFMDMMLLSHTDVVVAARPSSFTQSLPMSLVLATPQDSRKVAKPFCEMDTNANEMRCYRNFQEWCCTGDTRFMLGDIKQRYEYLRMPEPDLADRNQFRIETRGEKGCIPRPEGWKQPCLPYNFSEYNIVPRKQKRKKNI